MGRSCDLLPLCRLPVRLRKFLFGFVGALLREDPGEDRSAEFERDPVEVHVHLQVRFVQGCEQGRLLVELLLLTIKARDGGLVSCAHPVDVRLPIGEPPLGQLALQFLVHPLSSHACFTNPDPST